MMAAAEVYNTRACIPPVLRQLLSCTVGGVQALGQNHSAVSAATREDGARPAALPGAATPSSGEAALHSS